MPLLPSPPRHSRAVALRLLPLVALLAAGACGDDADPALTREALVGEWTLRRIDGVALPAPVSATPDRTEVAAGTLALGADGLCSDRQTLRVTPAPGSSFGGVVESLLASTCRWTLDDGRLALSYQAPPSAGVLGTTQRLATLGRGNVLTVHVAGVAGGVQRWEYER